MHTLSLPQVAHLPVALLEQQKSGAPSRCPASPADGQSEAGPGL